jgi:hypothetical protein
MEKYTYNENYQVDKQGNVYSKGKKLNPPKYTSGYYVQKIYLNGKYTRIGVHRMIAHVFIPNPQNKAFVNHINGIKTDNTVENLEWVTSHENHIHAMNLGLKAKGESHGCSKLKTEDVYKIKNMLKDGIPQRKISKLFNVGQSAITDINLGKTWKHL